MSFRALTYFLTHVSILFTIVSVLSYVTSQWRRKITSLSSAVAFSQLQQSAVAFLTSFPIFPHSSVQTNASPFRPVFIQIDGLIITKLEKNNYVLCFYYCSLIQYIFYLSIHQSSALSMSASILPSACGPIGDYSRDSLFPRGNFGLLNKILKNGLKQPHLTIPDYFLSTSPFETVT